MKINMLKNHGGILCPASDIDADLMQKFKSELIYEIEIRKSRNPHFHGMVFRFFQFCFKYWADENGYMCEKGQFDVFRKNMTVMAGYYDTYHTIDGGVRIEAKSLSFASMDQKEFEECYTALTAYAYRRLFAKTDDITMNTLLEFFR